MSPAMVVDGRVGAAEDDLSDEIAGEKVVREPWSARRPIVALLDAPLARGHFTCSMIC